MADYCAQESDLIYALDIGTRGLVGVVGRPEKDRFRVLAIETAEHGRRTMIDGQIDNIRQVAELTRTVTERLQERLGVRLERVCVAAAGRALRTEKGSFVLELAESGGVTTEEISRVEAGAVSAAEEALQMDEELRKQFFLVGYTVAQYRLDHYPLSSLLDHNGKRIEADVVATFLPDEVVESLYAAMRLAELQVASLTLEPIAAMNAAIPAELRLLNLALVDVGAGTTDIAICSDGSVVGYTMATIAGDEITEAIMRKYLVDFQMAERMKRSAEEGREISYQDILGLGNTCSWEDFRSTIQEPMERLAKTIAEQVVELNGAAPSALFLAGGGSKLCGLRQQVARCLEMDERRVAIAGSNYEKSVFSEDLDLMNPELATPLGIAISSGMGLLNDSYMIRLNGAAAKLFRSGTLTLRDILMMNGYTYADLLPRSGKHLSITLDGQRMTLRGEPGTPAVLQINGEEAPLSRVVHAGDQVTFVPAAPGKDAERTVGQLLKEQKLEGVRVLVNRQEVSLERKLLPGDAVVLLKQEQEERGPAPAAPVPEPNPIPEPTLVQRGLKVLLNQEPLRLEGKADGTPYYLMDLLEKTEIDFEHLDRRVRMEVNDVPGEFTQELKEGDVVTIQCEEERPAPILFD